MTLVPSLMWLVIQHRSERPAMPTAARLSRVSVLPGTFCLSLKKAQLNAPRNSEYMAKAVQAGGWPELTKDKSYFEPLLEKPPFVVRNSETHDCSRS